MQDEERTGLQLGLFMPNCSNMYAISTYRSDRAEPDEMFALGAGALPVIGTTEQVALKLKRLYELGMDGVLMAFLSYYEDTVRFGKEIAPLLRQMGVLASPREPPVSIH